ncbi:hypothetical protein N7468_000484 [Penicillium chermesinum]|uniref:Vitamin B6 transporter n=1 Tax=Penicillium chermesinum TaxID=63820 RepID=A0A9W9TYE1_9EURO|nr:uncharacterized protein N7468_000484 [Penicillium chermesinum]KAJ5249033.1 hypothetical protein N7468_000484 [Penicillium chermesinum]
MAPSIPDEETGLASKTPTKPSEADEVQVEPIVEGHHGSILSRVTARLHSLNFFETRGIERVPVEERHEAKASDYMQMALLWFSTNITANNMAVGMLGPLDYSLGFVDCALCATFGALLGAAGVAYMGTFGPVSGNRTMVRSEPLQRSETGAKESVCSGGRALFHGVLPEQDCVSAEHDHHAWSLYRWAWVPQFVAVFVLIGSAGPKFDTSIESTGSSETIAGNRLSFFSLCLSAAVAWAPAGADFYVYFPPTTSKWKTFLLTFLGVGLAITFANLVGIGLASGTLTQPSWADAFNTSSGALVVAGYSGLGGFGKFLGVLVALGLIANNIPGTYSAGLGFQIMGRYLAKVPRWLLSTVGVVIYTACALGGRNELYEIFENFLALMGYWVTIYLMIAFEEHVIFRRTRGFDWDAWSDPSRLPVGIAALAAFLVGWAGAIVCMDQVWYVGPIAKMVGEDGSDLGIWVGVSWAMLVFPPLRWWELKKFNR